MEEDNLIEDGSDCDCGEHIERTFASIHRLLPSIKKFKKVCKWN